MGYRVEGNGSVAVLYSVNGHEVEDRMGPLSGGKGLRRTITIKSGEGELRFLGNQADAIPAKVEFDGGRATVEEVIEW